MLALQILSRPVVVLLSLGAVGLLAGCGAASSAPARAGGVKVVVTTTQLGDFVREVGGDRAQVVQILQPNSDPHEYEPRPDDVKALLDAPLVFESGNDLDAWMGKVVRESGGNPRIVTLADSNVARVPGESSGPEASRHDPHWWHDPRNVAAAISLIRDALTRANPAARGVYARNARAYLARLARLDAGIAACMHRVPAAQRKLVTDHDAFGYFARRYGIEVIGAVIPSQTTQAQPSAGDVARLVATIRRERVHAVFPESSVSPKLARAIAAETGASSSYTLYGDTLGPAGSDGATYLAMERHNADAMVRGFTAGRQRCSIPGLGPANVAPVVQRGDAIRVERADGAPAGAERYGFVSVDRRATMLWLAAIFAALVIVLARRRGLLALIGFVLSLLLVVRFVVPAISDGRPAFAVALVGSFAVVFITVGLTYGLRPRVSRRSWGSRRACCWRR
jgi:ABC-type Zn uptake system ZnuABC Zn-binding protein ZnuA